MNDIKPESAVRKVGFQTYLVVVEVVGEMSHQTVVQTVHADSPQNASRVVESVMSGLVSVVGILES